MASRVNLKFVFGLGSVLVLIAIVVVYFGLRNWMAPGVAQNIERGKQAEKEGDYKKAITFYGRAVNKDRGDLKAIKAWFGAIEKYVPPGRQAYEDMYVSEYTGALRALAAADRSNPAPYKRFLEERYQIIVRTSASLRSWENFAREYDDLMKSFTGDEKGRNALRRYRGLAREGMFLSNHELSENIIKEGVDDLNAALAVDPKDGESVIALSTFERGLAERTAKLGHQAEADRQTGAARARLEKFLAENPDKQRVRYALLSEDITSTAQKMAADAKPGTMMDVLKINLPGITAMAEAIKSAPPEQSDIQVALGIAPWIMVTTTEGPDRMDEMLAHVRKGHPTDPLFMLGCARLESSRNRFDKSIALTKEVVALPDKPMSLDGLLLHAMRARAIQMQADATFASWELEKDATKKEEIIKAIRDLRKDLAARVGETDASVLGIDGRLALVSGDIPGARAIISAYNDQTQQGDASMLLLEAELLARIGQKGAAKTKFERVIQLDKQNIRALRSLGVLEAEDEDFRSAAAHLGFASQLYPGDPSLKELAEHAAQLAAGKYDQDPVVGVLREVQLALMGTTGDLSKAIKLLRDALAEPKNAGDIRLSMQLAQYLAYNKDVEGAKAVLDACIKKNPKNPRPVAMRDRIDKDPVELYLKQIDEATGATETQKHLLRYAVLIRASKPDEARRELGEAAKAEPDNPVVVDNQFDDAVMRKDEAEQDRIVAKAQTFNYDRVGGALYRSRSLVARGKISEAIAGFREVVSKDKLNLLAWRLLGMALLEQSRYGEAIDALRTSIGIKPDDIPSVTSYIQALVAAKREGEALVVARKAENIAGGDPTFFEMYLMLEASGRPGGDKAKAIEARKKKAERSPDDRGNKARLATLLVNSNRMPEAETLIRELRTAKPNDPIALQIEAAFLGGQGKVADAVKLLQNFIAGVPEKERTAELYINMARLLRQLGEPDESKRILEGARPVQDPKTALIDREIGDMMYDRAVEEQDTDPAKAAARAKADLDEALAAYQKVLDGGGPDTGNAVRKRMIEVCVKGGRFDEMNKIISDLPAGTQGEATILLLQAKAATIQNDRVKALRLYDQAVAADPKNPIVFLERGDFKAADPRLVKDAIADYELMIRVDQDSIIARVRLAKELRHVGRDDAAVQRVKECIAIEPFNEQFRLALAMIYTEIGRPLEAAQTAEEAVTQFGATNKQWQFLAGQYWAKVPDWGKAVEHMLAVWQDQKTPDIAVPLVEYLLNKGDVTNAFNVLGAKELASELDKSLALKMLRARVLARSNRSAEAVKLITEALADLKQDSPQDTSLFMSGVTGIYTKGAAEQVQLLDRLETAKPFKSWLALKVNSLRLRDPSSKDKALLALNALTGDATTPDPVKAAVWSLLGTEAYSAGKFDEARERFERGSKLDPENIELCNNLGYILAVKLNKCAEALPFAQKAVRSAPQNSGYLDTLGSSQLCGKSCDEAAQTLGLALNAALNDGERVPVYIHLGKARLCQGDKLEARRLAGQARDLMANMPSMRQQYDEDLKDLDRAIDSK